MNDDQEKQELRDMVAALTKQVATLIGTMTPIPSRYTLYTWLDEWLRTYKANEVEPTSLYQLRNCIDKHFKPHMPDRPLGDLSAIDLDKAFGQIDSSRMRKYTYDTVCAALHKAYVLDLIDKDIAGKTQPVKHVRCKREPLTADEEKQFLQVIRQSKYYLLWLFYLVSGVRRSEALRVKWSDVHIESNTLFIDGTKTATSKRFIPLFDDIKYVLEQQPHTADYIFPYPLYSVRNAWDYMTDKFALPYTLHNLRHTFATRHHENGVPDNVIQHWLGHSNVKTTQDIYIHLTDDYARDMAVMANRLRNVTGFGKAESLYRQSKRARNSAQ